MKTKFSENNKPLNQSLMIIEFWKTDENPITCYKSRKIIEVVAKKIPKKQPTKIKVPVTVVSQEGVKEEFESVVKAADAVGMNPSTLASFLNGRAKNKTEYTIYKSILNN